MTFEEDISELPGLDFLRRLVDDWHASGMAETLGLRLVAVADGTATFEAWAGPRVYNPQMRAHGGFAAALIDSAMGCAVQTKMGPGIGFGTIDITVKYTRAITAEAGRLLCVGTVFHHGRTTCTAEAKLTDEQGRLYAHGIGTFMVYPK
jgi:acyl-CoA thioesterase